MNGEPGKIVDGMAKDEHQAAAPQVSTTSPPRLRLAEAQYTDGLAFRAAGDRNGAIKAQLAAYELEPRFDPALAELADIAFHSGDGRSALSYMTAALGMKPDNAAYKNAFVAYFQSADIYAFNPELKDLILSCLESDEVSRDTLFAPWLTLLKVDPDFYPYLKLLKQTKYKKFKKQFPKVGQYGVFWDPFFLLGLQNLTPNDMEFKIFLKHLRQLLLESLNPVERKLIFLRDPAFDQLRTALADHLFSG